MNVSIIADLNTENAIRAFELSGYKREDIVITNDFSTASDALLRERPIVTQDAELIPILNIDAIVDATGSPELGARIAFKSIQEKKHIIMLNVETDVVVGPILHQMAENAGIVYTVSSGDEPGL